jgi:hypothetical protein
VLLSQATGITGHLLFERSHLDMRDLVFMARIALLGRMFFAVLRGRYWHGRPGAQYADVSRCGA